MYIVGPKQEKKPDSTMNKSHYFQHDYNSANDHKILFLRQQFGIEGYGIFWYVIEQLAQSNGKLPLKIIPVLAMQIQTTPDKVKAVVCNYELFEIEDDQFFSVRLNSQLEFRAQLSEDGRAGALKRWGNKAKNSPPISTPNSKERKGKERKGSKGEIFPEVFPAVQITRDEIYWEQISMKYRAVKPKEILERWEAWYVNKFEWRKKELAEIRISFESWLKDPKGPGKKVEVNRYKVQ